MWVYYISPPSLSLIGALNIEICIIGKEKLQTKSRWDVTVNRGLFQFEVVTYIWYRIKISRHSIKGGSVIVGVERVSVTYTENMQAQ